MTVRFVYECHRCGFSTGSDSPDLVTCPIPWDANGVHQAWADPCGWEYEDGPMLDWDLLPNDIKLAVRDLLRPDTRRAWRI